MLMYQKNLLQDFCFKYRSRIIRETLLQMLILFELCMFSSLEQFVRGRTQISKPLATCSRSKAVGQSPFAQRGWTSISTNSKLWRSPLVQDCFKTRFLNSCFPPGPLQTSASGTAGRKPQLGSALIGQISRAV